MSLIELKTEVFYSEKKQNEDYVSVVVVGTVLVDKRVQIVYRLPNDNRVRSSADKTSINLLKFQFSELIKQDLKDKRIL